MDLKDSSRQIPWVVYEAKDWLDSFLTKDMKVFEWGSGGSTLYFCKRVQEVVSVEHNEGWYSKVSKTIRDGKIHNCEYYLIQPKKNYIAEFLPYNCEFYNSKTFQEYKSFSFKSYVKKIDEYVDEYFDLIFIDGRSRIACLKHSLKKVKRGGVVVLDNSEREPYQSEMNKLGYFKREDFFGHGPLIEDVWQTTVWYRTKD